MKKPYALLLLVLFPIILSYLFEIFFKEVTILRFYNVVENVLFVIFILALSFLITSLKLKRLFLLTSICLVNVCLLFETVYFYLFDNSLNASAVFVILESNSNETKDFLSVHLDRYIVILILIFFLINIYTLTLGRKFLNAITEININNFFAIEVLIMIYFTLKSSVLIVYNVPYLLIKTPVIYYQEMKKFKNYGRENKVGAFTNVKETSKEKTLYVVALGESTNRKHFNIISNYYRETTPLLNEIKDELFVFNNVISPHTYTIGALSKALTLGNYENPEGKYKGSIVQLFNQADYKTYWISNQRPVGVMDTHTTKIGLGASESFFLNTKHTNENTILDDKLISAMKKVLLEEGDKKIIFLHMLGTHMKYENRYPANEDYFKDIPETNFNKEISYKTINAYDNAVRYNDNLLKQVIDVVKAEKMNSYVLYFSDHGQEVFDDIDFFGHTIDERITRNMYEIPMFLWLSDDYKLKNKLNINNKYMTDDMIHSIADLSDVTCDQVDITRSIFNKNFKERKRIIKDTIDYDTYFK